MTLDFFTANRDNLQNSLPGYLLIIAANSLLQSSADLSFRFRQDSSFWYLCGINEPDMILLLDTVSGEATLLLPGQNDYKKEWEGETNTDELQAVSGISQFDSVSSLQKRLKAAKKKGQKIGYLPPLDEIVQPYGFYSNPARRRAEKLIKAVDQEPEDIRATIARLRSIKQPEEIAAIQRAVDITGETLADVKSRLKEFSSEKDIERTTTAGFYTRGADGHAYDPIIAGGGNAAIIHYERNNAPVEQNTLLLLDVGAQYESYASDISRTWAIGKASQRQKDIYDLVLEVQEAAFAALKPGVLLKEYQEKMDTLIREKLRVLGIELDRFPHGFSHFMGLDVHDAGDYAQPLQENMVLTVEPGVYLPDEGIGVRVEDNIIITKNGIRNLSEKYLERIVANHYWQLAVHLL